MIQLEIRNPSTSRSERIVDESFLNFEKLQTVFVTVDVDWAPDFMLESIIATLEEYGIKATFFATHRSPVIERLQVESFHEVGLHPNLNRGGSHPVGIGQAIGSMLEFVPSPVGVRFHRLGHEYRDLAMLSEFGIRYDVSRLNFNGRRLESTFHPDLQLTLFTYSWEDGISENIRSLALEGSIDLKSPGMKIVNFHPVNVFMNFLNSFDRKEFQAKYPKLESLSMGLAMSEVRTGPGSGHLFHQLCAQLANSRVKTPTLAEAVSL
jgi:hypothetical protein